MSVISEKIQLTDVRIAGLQAEVAESKYSRAAERLKNLQERRKWLCYLDCLSQDDRDKILLAAISELIAIDYVRFREADPNDNEDQDELYWESCGDDLRGEPAHE